MSFDGAFVIVLIFATIYIPGVKAFYSHVPNAVVPNTLLNDKVSRDLYGADYQNSQLDDSVHQEIQNEEEKEPDHLNLPKKVFRNQNFVGFKDKRDLYYEGNPQTFHRIDRIANIQANNFNVQIDSNLSSPKTENIDDQYNPHFNVLKEDRIRQTSTNPQRRKLFSHKISPSDTIISSQHGVHQKFNEKPNPKSIKHFHNRNVRYIKQNNLKFVSQLQPVLKPNRKNTMHQNSAVNNDVDNFFRSFSLQNSPLIDKIEDANKANHISKKHSKSQHEIIDIGSDNEEDEIPKTPLPFQALFPSNNSKVKRQELPPAEIEKIVKVLEPELSNILGPNGTNPCSNCTEIIIENAELKIKKQMQDYESSILMPAYPCDDWFPNNRTCWLNRNIGMTVTFVLKFGEGPRNVEVQWRKEFHQLNSKKRRIFLIDPDRPFWNMVVGNSGHEFRLSPITETDIDLNSFSAVVLSSSTNLASVHSHHNINFRIKVLPINQFVYAGGTVTLNMHRISHPKKGVRFKWYTESDGDSNLPSNMQKKGVAGEMLVISEFMRREGGIIACSVFTNSGFLATKARFLINVNSSGLQSVSSTIPSVKKRKRREIEEPGLDYMERKAASNSRPRNKKEIRLGTTNIQVSSARVEDRISKVIASCRSDLYCAPSAYCVKALGFCRCKNGYRGNGFFCWELAQVNVD